jgi:predicted PurR-regulated permease PerM
VTRDRDVVRITLIVVGCLVVLWVMRLTSVILLAVFLAIVFGIALAAGVDRLERWRVPRALGTTLILLAFFGCLTGLGLWLAPTVRLQSVELRQKLPVALERVQSWLAQKQTGLESLIVEPSSDSVTATGVAVPPGAVVAGREAALRERIARGTAGASRFVYPVLHSTLVVLGGLLFVTFLAAYFGLEPGLYRRGVLAIAGPRREARAAEVLDRIADVLRKWLVTQLIVMAVMGAASTAALLVLRVKAAVALGVLAGALSFIPTVGGIVGAAPAVAMGFLDSPQKALLVANVYLLIHFAGSHVLVPVLMKGGINLPPALTLIAQAVLTALFGFVGLMVAVPLLATVLVVVRATYVEPMRARRE